MSTPLLEWTSSYRLVQRNRQHGRATHAEGGVTEPCPDLVGGQSIDQNRRRLRRLQSGQRNTEAAMQIKAEGQARQTFASDVEFVRALISLRVPVRAAKQHHDSGALGEMGIRDDDVRRVNVPRQQLND